MSEPIAVSEEGNVVRMPYAVFERMEEYEVALKARLLRATRALDKAEIPYAIIGGNAVAAYVSQVDEDQARKTNDVDLLLNRSDFERAKEALAKEGFVYRHATTSDMFLDGKTGRASQAVHVIFAGEKVRLEYLDAAPNLAEVSRAQDGYSILSLLSLVRMKLTSYRMKDRVHLQDLLGVGLLDESWMEKVPASLRPRMREVLDNPPDNL